MKYLSFIFILFISYSLNLYGQIKTIVQSEVENIIFKAEVLNYSGFVLRDTSLYYKIGDTVEIEYSVTNNSTEAIYVFDPSATTPYSLTNPEKDSLYCRYIFPLGGTYFYEHRAEKQYLKLIKLAPSETLEHTFRYVLSEEMTGENCEFGVEKSRSRGDEKTNLILFDIGYVFISDDIRLTEEDEEGYRNITNWKDAFLFEAHLRKFYLGPLIIEFRK
jgi:hypothetical protein